MTTTCPECNGAGIVEIVWRGVSPNAADAALDAALDEDARHG